MHSVRNSLYQLSLETNMSDAGARNSIPAPMGMSQILCNLASIYSVVQMKTLTRSLYLEHTCPSLLRRGVVNAEQLRQIRMLWFPRSAGAGQRLWHGWRGLSRSVCSPCLVIEPDAQLCLGAKRTHKTEPEHNPLLEFFRTFS